MASSQHKYPAKTYRPEPTEHADVTALLPPGLTMDGLARACLRWVRANPEEALAVLAPHWPPAKPIGRPVTKNRPNPPSRTAAP
jgi:hypothetical protein